MHRPKVLEPKSRCEMANTFDFGLPTTVKWQRKSYCCDKVYEESVLERYHTSQTKSSQCARHIGWNDDRQAAFIHASKGITHLTDHVHMVDTFEIAYGRPWKSGIRS
jgi:hypothetical protein